MLTDEQLEFTIRTNEELSGTIAMLMEEAHSDRDLHGCIAGNLLMHAFYAYLLFYNQDRRKAIKHVHLMMDWEQSRGDHDIA